MVDTGPDAPDSGAAPVRGRPQLAHLLLLDFLIPAVLGVISVSGAFLTSASLASGGDAISAERLYGLERNKQEIAWARAEGDVQAALEDFGALSVESDLSRRLEESAAALPAGDPRAVELRAESAELSRVAHGRWRRSQAPERISYETMTFRLDEKALRLDLRRNYEGLFPPTPDLFVREAAAARVRTERLAIMIVALAAAGLFVTVAHVSSTRKLKAALAGIGIVTWVGVMTAYALWAT